LLLAGWLGLRGAPALALGMVAFGLGHVSYWRGFRSVVSVARGYPLGGALVAAVFWVAVVGLGPAPLGALAWGALAYGALLGAMAGAAVALAARERRYWPIAAGAVAFFVSDGVLSAQLFHPELFAAIPRALRGDVVWLLYGPGQAAIVATAPFVADASEDGPAGPR
jgi:uncharacterized membrane protein YhhN